MAETSHSIEPPDLYKPAQTERKNFRPNFFELQEFPICQILI